MKEVFPDLVVVELPNAKHFVQEDALDEIVAAIITDSGDCSPTHGPTTLTPVADTRPQPSPKQRAI